MAVTQYIGSRYVPLFADPIEWSSQNTYEPLTIVTHQGNSYTSKQAVPKGIDITNEAFWAMTGNYDAQIELYRQETQRALSEAQAAQESADNAQNDIDTLLPKEDFSSENTVKNALDDISQAVQDVSEYTDAQLKTALRYSAVAPIRLHGRLLDPFGYKNRARVLANQSVCYSNGEYFSCGSLDNNARQTITVFDQEGQIVRTHEYTNLYHANSITADSDGHIIVASGDGLNLHVINAQSLAHITTVSLTLQDLENIFAVCYDAESDFIYMRCRDVFYNNYVARTKLNGSESEVLANLGKQVATTAQGFAYRSGMAYLLNNFRDTIYAYDVASATLVSTYEIPDGDGYFPMGEAEDLFFVGNDLLFNSPVYYNSNQESSASINYLFNSGITNPTQAVGTLKQTTGTDLIVTVNPNNPIVFCPTTTFTTAEEACAILGYHKGGTINLNDAIGTVLLTDGNYSIQCSEGTTIKHIYAYNAQLTTRRANVEHLSCTQSHIYCYITTITDRMYLINCQAYFNKIAFVGATINAVISNLEFLGSVDLDASTTITTPSQAAFNSAVKISAINSTFAHKLLRLNNISRASLRVNSTSQMAGGNIPVASYQADTFTVEVSGGGGSSPYTSIKVNQDGKFTNQSDAVLSSAMVTMECC